mgnify:CR=1 FL=1
MARKSQTEIENELKPIGAILNNALVYEENRGPLDIRYFYCKPVETLVKYIRNNTRARNIGATHHVLKILFNLVEFAGQGALEYSFGGRTRDIFLQEAFQSIEVKTIKHMDIDKLYGKALGLLESEGDDSDMLWIFYFDKVAEGN